MNKTFKNYITGQIAIIRDMLFLLGDATKNIVGYNYELEKVLFDAVNALIDFVVILERVNENMEERK